LIINIIVKILKCFNRTKSSVSKLNTQEPERSADMTLVNDAVDKLRTEGGESFYNYVDSLGFSNDSNLIVLSSRHHYYYDSEEIDKAKTVVNLKELNRIKEIKSILQSHLHFLPKKCNFVGCFVNNKKNERFGLKENATSNEKVMNSDDIELGILSRFPFLNMLYSLMDSKTNNYLSEERVASMLGVHGFKVIDMKEVNGLTFFHSQKLGNILN
jgi:hypothetical protein